MFIAVCETHGKERQKKLPNRIAVEPRAGEAVRLPPVAEKGLVLFKAILREGAKARRSTKKNYKGDFEYRIERKYMRR